LKILLPGVALLLTGCNESSSDSGTPLPANRLPVASLVATPVDDGRTLHFTDRSAATATGIHDPDGRVVRVELEFGDGQVFRTTIPVVSALDILHTYTADGVYALTLTVWDDDGASAMVSRSLTVRQGPVNNVATGSLNDSGATLCATDTAFLADCTPDSLGLWVDLPQDALRGRDRLAAQGALPKAGAGEAGFDYTKISSNGRRLPADAASWVCVLDNHTGLMWEAKNAGGGLRDWRHRYTWYHPDPVVNGGQAGYQDVHAFDPDIAAGITCGNTLPLCNTHAYAAKVNETGLCGHKDWRLPDQEQLLTLPHYGRLRPAIETAYFPHTASACIGGIGGACGQYWSSSSLATNFASAAWFVNFADGYDSPHYKYGSYHVRLVRSGS